MDDQTYALVKDVAGGNVSEWITRACRKRLLADEAAAVARAMRDNPEATRVEYDEYEAERAESEGTGHRGHVA